MLRGAGADTPRGALCALLTLPGDSYLKLEKLAKLNVMFFIDMKFISMILEILFEQFSLFPGAHLHIIR